VNAGAVSSAAAALVDAYGRVADRDMSTLPGYNGRLRLEAVGFRAWEGHYVGVLVAPWFMNLVLLPGAADDWSELAGAESSEWKFPAEKILFNPCTLAGPGLHLTASLFTDLTGFPDQATARAVGLEVMERLFQGAAEPGDEAAAAGASRLLERPVSRRGLFALAGAAGSAEHPDDA
jgi:[NiFe] hydrogenase assembly HybE family chaperone